MKKNRFYHRFNVFATMLVSTVLPCFLATLFFGMVFLPMMNRTASNNDKARAQVLMDTVSSQFADLYESVNDMTNVVQHSSWIHSLYLHSLNTDVLPDPAVRIEITRDMNMACVRNEAKSLSFKFYDSPVLYNNRGVVSEQERYEETYRNTLQYSFYSANMQQEAFSTIIFDGVEYLLYQCPFRDIEGGRYKGEINILFQSSTLGSKLAYRSGSQVAAFRLTDAEGNNLWEYYTDLYNEETVTLSQSFGDGKFQCCIDVPISVYRQTRGAVVPSVLITLAISLIISVCLAYLLSRASYRPIGEIVGKFVDSDEDTENEFVALERVFDRILREKTEAENSLDRLRPMARQKLLGGLLDGTAFLGDSAEDQMEYCQLRFEYERLNVIALEVPFSPLQEKDVELTSELAMETLLEHLEGSLPLKAWLYYKDSDHYQILVNYQSWENLQSYISMLMANCRQYFRDHTAGEGIYLGVGQVVFSLEELYRAAEQADTAINVAALNRLEQPMFYSEVAPELNYDYFYPMSEEILLSRAVTGGNAQTALELLENIIKENTGRPQLNPKCLWMLYLDLSSTVSRSAQSLGITVSPVDIRESYITLEEVRLRVGKMIEDVCNQIQSRRQKTMNGAEVQILAYIDEHIYDPELSLNSIAERFQKSSTYISLLFKEQRGIHYNTYVNQTRIMRAVELMSEQNLDSNTVYPMVGYVSLSTFRRNFTKYAKSTPGTLSREP